MSLFFLSLSLVYIQKVTVFHLTVRWIYFSETFPKSDGFVFDFPRLWCDDRDSPPRSRVIELLKLHARFSLEVISDGGNNK